MSGRLSWCSLPPRGSCRHTHQTDAPLSCVRRPSAGPFPLVIFIFTVKPTHLRSKWPTSKMSTHLGPPSSILPDAPACLADNVHTSKHHTLSKLPRTQGCTEREYWRINQPYPSSREADQGVTGPHSCIASEHTGICARHTHQTNHRLLHSPSHAPSQAEARA